MTRGQRIRLLREKSSLTQEQVGRELGVLGRTVWAWENDRVKSIRDDHLVAIARLFETTTDYILGHEAKN